LDQVVGGRCTCSRRRHSNHREIFSVIAESIPVVVVEEDGVGIGRILAAKKPLVTADISTEETFSLYARQMAEEYGLQAGAFIPLLANDRSIGVLVVPDQRGRRFTENEISLLIAFADQAALALEKARLPREAERDKERSDALYQVSDRLAGAHDTGEVLDLIVNEAASLVGVSASYIRLWEEGTLVTSAATEGASDFVAELRPVVVVGQGPNLLGQAMGTKKPVVSEDAAEDQATSPEGRLLIGNQGFHGAAAVPLLANNSSIGVLAVMDKRKRLFTEEEISLLTAFADPAALALEKARLLSAAEREKERSNALYQVSNRLAGAHDADEVLGLIVNEAARLVRAPAEFIRILEGDVLVAGAATESAAAFFADTAIVQPGLAVAEGVGLMGHVMATKNPSVVEDITTGELVGPAGRLVAQQHDVHGVAAVPLLANDRSIGVLAVFDKIRPRWP